MDSVPHSNQSGLVRGVTMGNQAEYVHGQCFVVPILRYQRPFFNKQDELKKVRVVNGDDNDCFPFLAKLRELTIHLEWNSGDDLDIAALTPHGEVIYFRNKKTQKLYIAGGGYQCRCLRYTRHREGADCV